MKRKGKRERAAAAVDWTEFEAKHALEYRLAELLMICEGIAIGMNDSFVYEVWGKLRFAPGAEMVRLASAPEDLREAVRLAYEAANELQMARSVQVRTVS